MALPYNCLFCSSDGERDGKTSPTSLVCHVNLVMFRPYEALRSGCYRLDWDIIIAHLSEIEGGDLKKERGIAYL